MRRFRLLSTLRSRRTAFVLALLMLVSAFPASANYEGPGDYHKVAYEYGGESCGVVMITFRCTWDFSDGIALEICEVIARNCLG